MTGECLMAHFQVDINADDFPKNEEGVHVDYCRVGLDLRAKCIANLVAGETFHTF